MRSDSLKCVILTQDINILHMDILLIVMLLLFLLYSYNWYMGPKLKDKYIDLPQFSAMCVYLAAQVLSHSVAVLISTLVTLKHLHERSIYTAQFMKQFDALYNTFNSKSLKSSQRLGHAFNDSSGSSYISLRKL